MYSILNGNSDPGNNSVTHISPFDNYSGLQIVKDIVLSENRSEVTIHATFYNKSTVMRKWSIWLVCQMNTSGKNIEDRYQIVCPVNSGSKFEKGYKVMHGIINNPQNGFNAYGNMAINYKYIVGKVGLDTASNWVAFIDKESGKVLVLMFDYQEDNHILITLLYRSGHNNGFFSIKA